MSAGQAVTDVAGFYPESAPGSSRNRPPGHVGIRTYTCSYVCNSGQIDCNAGTAPDTDGCECSRPTCCGSSCETSHTTGLSSPSTYYNCSATGNSTETDAMNACSGVGASGCAESTVSGCQQTCLIICGTTSADSVCGTLNGTCYCWQYSGPNAGKVQSAASDGGACNATCGASSNPTWN